jgi:hypothetical protein
MSATDAPATGLSTVRAARMMTEVPRLNVARAESLKSFE